MDLEPRLREVLPVDVLALLHGAARAAEARGWQTYLVGGYVRDSLLRVPDYDIDIAVVGDAPALARLVAEEAGARLEVHPAFGTAVLILGDGAFDIDIVTARRETYERPGALPTVEPGTIEDDLARRDFTVNAMAVQILPERIGPVLDPHGGLDDMQARLIRVLHPASFIDDPTRIFRAVKLGVRLGFALEQGTLELILRAVRDGAPATISKDRITHELLLVMGEPKGGVILHELDRLGVLRALHPLLGWPYEGGRMSPPSDAPLTATERQEAHLAVLGAEFAGDPEEAESIARYLHLPAHFVRVVRDGASLAALWPKLEQEELPPSRVYALLNGLDPAALRAYTLVEELAASPTAWARLHDYLDRLRHIRPHLTGNHLREMGVPPGPIYREALEALHSAKMDGLLPTPADEHSFLTEWLKEREV